MTMQIRITGAAVALVAVMGWSAAHALPGMPAERVLAYKVLRDGSEVGTHTVTFAERDGTVKVDVETHVNVKMPFLGISLYHFEHRGHELWRDGSLVELRSETDDDGTAHELSVTRAGEVLRVSSQAGAHDSPGSILPASLWHPGLVHRQVLLNTLDGHEMPVVVSDEGVDQVQVQGVPVSARHYRLSGGLSRELWYDDRGVLVKVSFAAEDDSRIDYVLP